MEYPKCELQGEKLNAYSTGTNYGNIEFMNRF